MPKMMRRWELVVDFPKETMNALRMNHSIWGEDVYQLGVNQFGLH